MLLLITTASVFSQVVLYTATQNTAGGGGSTPHPEFGTIYYDWSLGENTVVNTFNNADIVTTNGMLQPAKEFKSTVDLSDITIDFYPNPTSNFSWVDINITNQVGNLDGLIYNTLGQLVQPNSVSVNSSGRYRIDFSNLPAGMYVLWVRYTTPYSTDIRKKSFKVIKLN